MSDIGCATRGLAGFHEEQVRRQDLSFHVMKMSKKGSYIIVGTTVVFFLLLMLMATVVFVSGVRVRRSLVYRETQQRIRSSDRLVEKIGSPVKVKSSWSAPGLVQRSGPISYAHLRIPVEGSKDRGIVYAVANRTWGEWTFSDLVFSSEETKPSVSLIPPPRAPVVPYRGEGKIYLLPLGQPAVDLLENIPEYIKNKFGIELVVLPVLPLDSAVVDASRSQLVAQKVIESMKQAHRELVGDYGNILIGITERDMYIAGDRRKNVFNLRKENRFVVISTSHLETRSLFEPSNPLVMQSRFRKLLIKNIGFLYYLLPLTSDPTSALYGGVEIATDIDWMTEDFIGIEGVDDNAYASGDPLVSIIQPFQGTPVWKFEYGGWARFDITAEDFLADLGTGLFVQRRTDFYFNEAFPVAVIRKYRPRDNQSRAFGIGTNHSFDIFLVGDSEHFSFIDLILEDGARIHYKRGSPGTGFADAIFISEGQSDNAFSGSRLQWNGHGWDILRQDGWTFVFPPSADAHRSQQGALTGIHDARGHEFRLVRNSQGDLLSITTPEANSVRLDYDNKGRVMRAEDNHGRHLEYEYDDSGRLVLVQDSNGFVERYTYDSKGQMLTISVNARPLLINEYDAAGNLVEQTMSDGRKFRYRYTTVDNKPNGAEIIDPRGYLTRFNYGPNGEVFRLMPVVQDLK